MKLGEAIYKAEAEKNPTDPSTSDDKGDQNDGDIVDADFEDLDDQRNKFKLFFSYRIGSVDGKKRLL